jgi:hypothetical protein
MLQHNSLDLIEGNLGAASIASYTLQLGVIPKSQFAFGTLSAELGASDVAAQRGQASMPCANHDLFVRDPLFYLIRGLFLYGNVTRAVARGCVPPQRKTEAARIRAGDRCA